MSLISKIFGKQEPRPAETGIVFGRFTDLNKTEAQLEQWDKAVSLFRHKKYHDSIENLLEYLRRPSVNNVHLEKGENNLSFSINQGSTLIQGSAGEDSIKAEAKIIEFEKPQAPLMRKLLEMNFGLQYSFFSLNENAVYLKFESSISELSPDKFYYALKELATTSDKQDDLLTTEFKALKPVTLTHIIEVSGLEKKIKYKYFKTWIESAFAKAGELNEEQQQGAISYLYLALIYKMDYLLKPEGQLLNELEKIQAIFFSGESNSVIEKNRKIKDAFQVLLNKPEEEIAKSFYNIKNTFGIVNPATFQQVADFVFTEAEKVKWYRDNNMPEIEIAAYEYIIGYCFFNFGMYEPCIELLHLVMQVLNPQFFKEMGFSQEFYNFKTGRLEKEAIEDEITRIMKTGRKRFPHLMFLVTNLKFNSRGDFCSSFLKEFDFLNFTNALY
jgi:hypothetical protein